jgi:putative ABC transport system permease protein
MSTTIKPGRQSHFYPPVLWAVGWRYITGHRWQSVLMVFGIALGVAVMVAIDLANASAARAFELSAESITGKTTHQISGGPQGLNDTLYTDLRRRGIVEQAAPVISQYVSSPQLGNRPLQLLGIDPLADAPFRSYLSSSDRPTLDQLAAFMTQPGAIIISRQLASSYGLKLGDRLEIDVEGRPQTAFIAGLLNPSDQLTVRALDGTLLADISTAQELTGKIGRLDAIDLIIPPGDKTTLRKVEEFLPPGTQVTPAAARTSTIADMTAAFRLNLSALSLLALIVGLFLIYDTMTFSVVRRRPLFGALRCLGITGREVFAMVISEAFLVGLLGSLAGIGLGILMGQRTVAMVTRTINDLYFTTTVQDVGIPIQSLVKGGVLGVAATVLAAALPAREAASIPPQAALSRSGLEGKSRRNVLWIAGAGLVLLALGAGVFALPFSGLASGFGGTLAVVIGFAMLAAITMVILLRLAGPFTGRVFGLIGRMAPRNLINSLSRTAVAVAALMVAVAVTIGVTLMIDSFRNTVDIWLRETLQSDIYIQAPSFTANRSTVPISADVVHAVQGWPGLARVDLLRSTTLQTPSGPVDVSASSNVTLGQERKFLSHSVPINDIWQAMVNGAVIVSEPLAHRLNLEGAGKTITLNTPTGWRTFPIVGVYYDYASSQGSLYLNMDVYRRIWHDDQVTAIGIRLPPGTNVDTVTRALQNGLESQQRVLISSNQALRDAVLRIFDRTFAITAALRILATVVAFIGVLNTLMLLQLEKQRETGILRALGLTGRQLWRLVMLETGLMGFVAGILAAPTGYVLSLILIYVINRRSFGWTLQMTANPEAFVQGLVIAVVAALLAGIYPAGRLSRMAAAEAIRYE